ncbi:electron transfer flavoprotein subunit beta/FixA family protein [Halovenus sp. WSH3]|uniref:Electron transfer flavoprotein subunit beta/FixA family protein n=1 Tax=Halovenus carboxidivorans TaxID=2692199 RepID=A0A6B0T4X1_9EURY|nr:electron transfer flavoprotein subunit beta/FixA family protein [Halovenus carboxidivorans]MXR51226.1 electron transfer flavoprotein subunit beta/FixA family protein [Halovenus carboxidivorans]
MKILVTVTEVADADDEFEISGTSIADQYLTYDLNEWDDYAIEEAVQLSEEHDDIEVVTVTFGAERVEETIRTALAKGADRAIRVWDDSFEGKTILDPSQKAELLAGVVEEEEPDLVLSGVQSGDVAIGATGVALAEKIGYEWAAVVNQLDLDRDSGVASVHRELEGGVEELTDVEPPAVLTIQTGINEPRYASLRGIRQAQSKPLDVVSPDDLGVELEESAIELTELVEPESESDTELFEGSPEETAGQLAEFLREQGVGA